MAALRAEGSSHLQAHRTACSGLPVGIPRDVGGPAPLPSESTVMGMSMWCKGRQKAKTHNDMNSSDFAGTQIFLGSWDGLGLSTWKSQALHWNGRKSRSMEVWRYG